MSNIRTSLTRRIAVAIALLSVAASAEAGYAAVLSESASVTLIFVALGVAALASSRSARTSDGE